jgi:hypothetical protein
MGILEGLLATAIWFILNEGINAATTAFYGYHNKELLEAIYQERLTSIALDTYIDQPEDVNNIISYQKNIADELIMDSADEFKVTYTETDWIGGRVNKEKYLIDKHMIALFLFMLGNKARTMIFKQFIDSDKKDNTLLDLIYYTILRNQSLNETVEEVRRKASKMSFENELHDKFIKSVNNDLVDLLFSDYAEEFEEEVSPHGIYSPFDYNNKDETISYFNKNPDRKRAYVEGVIKDVIQTPQYTIKNLDDLGKISYNLNNIQSYLISTINRKINEIIEYIDTDLSYKIDAILSEIGIETENHENNKQEEIDEADPNDLNMSIDGDIKIGQDVNVKTEGENTNINIDADGEIDVVGKGEIDHNVKDDTEKQKKGAGQEQLLRAAAPMIPYEEVAEEKKSINFEQLADDLAIVLNTAEALAKAFEDGVITSDEFMSVLDDLAQTGLEMAGNAIAGPVGAAVARILYSVGKGIFNIAKKAYQKYGREFADNLEEQVDIQEKFNRLLDMRNRYFELAKKLHLDELDTAKEELDYIIKTNEEIEKRLELEGKSKEELIDEVIGREDFLNNISDAISDLEEVGWGDWFGLDSSDDEWFNTYEDLLNQIDPETNWRELFEAGKLNKEDLLKILQESANLTEEELEAINEYLDNESHIVDLKKAEIDERYRIAELEAELNDDEEGMLNAQIGQIEEMLSRADELNLTELERLELQVQLKDLYEKQNEALQEQGLLMNDNVRAIMRQVIEARKLGNSGILDDTLNDAYMSLLGMGYTPEQIEEMLGAEFDIPTDDSITDTMRDLEKQFYSGEIAKMQPPLNSMEYSNQLALEEMGLIREQNDLLRAILGESALQNNTLSKLNISNNTTTGQHMSPSNVKRFLNTVERQNRY